MAAGVAGSGLLQINTCVSKSSPLKKVGGGTAYWVLLWVDPYSPYASLSAGLGGGFMFAILFAVVWAITSKIGGNVAGAVTAALVASRRK